MKPTKLIYLLLVFLLFATCKKDRNRWFKTNVQGTVIDYFDLKPVEGVKVSVVYTYDFLEYSWPYSIPPSNMSDRPCKEPDTLAQTYTNAKGEFELKFPVKKKVDDCGLSGNVIHQEEGKKIVGNTDYGYLLIFEKPGTDYFKQYYSLKYADKNNINVLYRIRSLVTLEFYISTSDNTKYVGYSAYTISNSCIFEESKNTGISGVNLNTKMSLKVAFCSGVPTKITHSIKEQSVSPDLFFESENIIFNKPKYEFYASY
ncbi:MAG: hypothetical protein QY303_12110 [Vicingaceae bacterium]|nr:MAG: hypothetical protein QY303_12110 [Vicingaceae bacterium]